MIDLICGDNLLVLVMLIAVKSVLCGYAWTSIYAFVDLAKFAVV
ncbi:MAG: hypothetical protein R6X16_07460 [Anaerolineae bacterium]